MKLRTNFAHVEGLAEVDVMGSRSGGRLGEDANPNDDRIDDQFLSLALFSTLGIFFVLGRFIDLDLFETNDVYQQPFSLSRGSRLCNRMGEDFAQLLQMALGLRSPGWGPQLLARAVK